MKPCIGLSRTQEGVKCVAHLLCFFGWMDFMILYKWVTPMENPPSIINSLICMAMGQEDKMPIFNGAIGTSRILMFLSVCAVPAMLIPKPLMLYKEHQARVMVQLRGRNGHYGFSEL